MRHKILLFSMVLFGFVTSLAPRHATADSLPDVLYYRFDGTGTEVPNLASAPPAGTATANLLGTLTQTGADQNVGNLGHSILGNGVSSTTDFLNTGWAPDLGTSSWTISFVTANITGTSTLYYIFGDANTASLRCFTNGVAGANNWILRGAGLTDITVGGGATVAPHRITFVYDSTLNNVKGYLDGVLASTVAQTTPNLTGNGPFKVVGYSANVGMPVNGILDDFRVYRRALSEAEVQDLDKRSFVRVSGNSVYIVDGDTTPDASDNTDFGPVLAAGGSSTRSYSIENIGNVDLTLNNLQIQGANAADFSITTPPVSPVTPNTTTPLVITFTPTATGVRSATVTFENNDTASMVFSFDIVGEGVSDAVFGDGFE